MSMDNLTGSIVALVTPFCEDGSIDFEALERLVDFHLANGTDGILVLGTTGESSTMTDEEDLAVARFVVERVAGRIPVIGGAGSNCTAESMRKAEGLVKLGIDGLLLITPYYNKSNEEGIYRHFTYVMDRVDVPCILYNIPGRTGCSISESNLARLCKHPNAFAIKEASGSIEYATMAAKYLSDDFRMFSGNDDIVVPSAAAASSACGPTSRPLRCTRCAPTSSPATSRRRAACSSRTRSSFTRSSARSTPFRSSARSRRWALSARTTASRSGRWPTPTARA